MTTLNDPTFSIGVEEEYLLVRQDTRDLADEVPAGVFEECERLLGAQVSPEFLQCQIEVGTQVCQSMEQVKSDLGRLRRSVSEVAESHGLRLIAASTHPFATWGMQKRTDKPRYAVIAEDLQEVVRRLVICGMHVHVGIDDDDLRVDLMGQVSYILPHFLALTTSSPFWRGRNTGLKSYRISIWDEMPRTGLPEQFDSFTEFTRHVDMMVHAGIIEDGTKLWWDVRPSVRFPTLEMRICDIATRLEDGIAVAALYRCWLRMLWRLKLRNQRWRRYRNLLVNENRWRAHRYGIDEGLVDFGRGSIVPYADLLDEIIALVSEDAAHFGCMAEVEHARSILENGTSAHRQIAVFQQALDDGADGQEAQRAVVDFLAQETLRGI